MLAVCVGGCEGGELRPAPPQLGGAGAHAERGERDAAEGEREVTSLEQGEEAALGAGAEGEEKVLRLLRLLRLLKLLRLLRR